MPGSSKKQKVSPEKTKTSKRQKKESQQQRQENLYLQDSYDSRTRGNGSDSAWDGFLLRMNDFRDKINKKGRERLTVMVIPHTEKKIFNLHVNMFTIAGIVVTTIVILIVSVINLVGKSGEDIQFYDMGLTNTQFNMQSTRMAEEMIPLHKSINQYTNTIAELYLKLDGQEENVYGQGGAAEAIASDEIADLENLIEECRELGDGCDQGRTEEILRRILFLSRQDNENLRRAVELSDRVLEQLRSSEKQNLLANTPVVWPVRGYIITPYGWQTDIVRGRLNYRQGIEIGARYGAEIIAPAPGKITDIGYNDIYGLHMWVEHRFGIQTFYAHLDRLRVSRGDQVSRGQVIGYVGRSGNATMDMLYYEVHVGTVAYNPHSFLNHLQDQWLIQATP